MPFDPFSQTRPGSPVYDKDNLPRRMSEAIRMAVADVQALLDRGYRYDWDLPNFLTTEQAVPSVACACCAAGAVVARRTNYEGLHDWGEWGYEWERILNALSVLTTPKSVSNVVGAREYWRRGFAPQSSLESFRITDAAEDPQAFARDMVALADLLEAEGS